MRYVYAHQVGSVRADCADGAGLPRTEHGPSAVPRLSVRVSGAAIRQRLRVVNPCPCPKIRA